MSHVTTFRAVPGQFERLPIEADTLDEATLQLSHGIYTVIEIVPGRKLARWEAHVARLKRSAQLIDLTLKWDEGWMRETMRRAVHEGGLDLGRVRITIPFDAPESVLVMLDPFDGYPEHCYRDGVAVQTIGMQRQSPEVKATTFIEGRSQIEAQKPDGVHELIMVNDNGVIGEGVGSNFYGVLDGKLRTAERDILEGIARGIVLDAAESFVDVVFEPLRVGDLPFISEAMLSSATRHVMPVTLINGSPVGDGQPGPVYQKLHDHYEVLLAAELEAV